MSIWSFSSRGKPTSGIMISGWTLIPSGLHRCGCFKDCASLHFGNLREGDPQPATAMAEHWVELVQLMNAMGNLFNRYAELVRQFVLLRVIRGQKLV